MRRTTAVSSIVAVVIALLLFDPAVEACSLRTNPEFQLDPVEQAEDTSPPGQGVVASVSIHRGKGPVREQGCPARTSLNTCDHLGSIRIVLDPTPDDRTPTEQMGFRIELVDGEPPADFQELSQDFVTFGKDHLALDGSLYLLWSDGASDTQEAFDFSVTVRAIDLGGNLGEVSEPLRIQHPGSGGCAAAAPRVSSYPLLLLAGGLWLLRRRNHPRAN